LISTEFKKIHPEAKTHFEMTICGFYNNYVELHKNNCFLEKPWLSKDISPKSFGLILRLSLTIQMRKMDFQSIFQILRPINFGDLYT